MTLKHLCTQDISDLNVRRHSSLKTYIPFLHATALHGNVVTNASWQLVRPLMMSPNVPPYSCPTAVTKKPLNVFSSGRNVPQAAIVVCLLVFLGSATLVTLFSICRPANKLSFKQGEVLALLPRRTLCWESHTEQTRKDRLILIGRHYYSLSATLTYFSRSMY